MATIRQYVNGRWQAIIRRRGHPALVAELTPRKKSARSERQRLRFLRRRLGHLSAARIQSKHIASYRDELNTM